MGECVSQTSQWFLNMLEIEHVSVMQTVGEHHVDVVLVKQRESLSRCRCRVNVLSRDNHAGLFG